jgi:hypothetical protein
MGAPATTADRSGNPLAAKAQQRERMRSVGVLTPFAPPDSEGQNRVTAFVQALASATMQPASAPGVCWSRGKIS